MHTSSLPSLIPPVRLSAVEKALQQVFQSSDITDISLLTGGLSASPVYKITINSQHYVLKLDPSGRPPGNHMSQSSCMEIAAKAGIAPPLYYLNTEDALTITGFIENKPLRAVFPSPEILMDKLANTIRSIHELPLFAKGNSLLDTVDTLISQVKEFPFPTDIIFEDILAYYDTIKSHYPWHDTDTVSSHNDLNPNNIICDGEKIWIVDWDAAYRNDRYVDLAITANFFVHSEMQEKQFLEAYFGSTLNDYKRARFFIMRQICRLVYAILMFRLAGIANPLPVIDEHELSTASLKTIGEQLGSGKLSLSSGKGQLLYGKAMLNEALNNVRSPRFVSSIGMLSETSAT
jgi:aminoglycoside phosphotransferase (APT) family kinase protein